MVRRKFLAMLGMAPLVVKAAPLLEFAPIPVCPTVDGYFDYCTISELAVETAIDPVIEAAVNEWALRETQRLDYLINLEFSRA